MSIFNSVYKSFVPSRTFTISWEEKTDMSSGWTYSDDAAWLTAGSSDFDDFFWYSAVLLNTSGVETAEMKQTWWVFTWAMTTLGNITSGDNVMIKFPVRWIKMEKSWSVVTLSITDGLGRESEWFQYYAHNIWTLTNPWTPKNAFYLWAYKWYNSSNVLKSWSWKTPTWNQTQATFCTQAKANGSWYNIIGFYQRQYINALYMMKYWNPNAKNIIWKWYTSWQTMPNTWWTNSQTNATYWTSSNTTQIKLFWLEDRWCLMWDFLWWAYIDSNNILYTQLSWYSWDGSWWISTETTIYVNPSVYCMSSIAWNNKAMFSPTNNAYQSGSSYTRYYASFSNAFASKFINAGGGWTQDADANILFFNASKSYTSSSTDIWTRLVFV